MLLGYLYRPEGKGPFPAVIFHHGHVRRLTEFDVTEWKRVADLLTSHGYMLFVPDRHPEAIDVSEYSRDLRQKLQSKSNDPSVKNQEAIEMRDIIQRDVSAALQWLKQQPDVDTNRIAISGQFGGAIHTLYEVEKLQGVRALIPFSPATRLWKRDLVIRGLLTQAVRNSKLPIFLIYADNEPPEPAEALGVELQQKGAPNRLRIYRATGKILKDHRNLVSEGADLWGKDFLNFLRETMK